MTLPQVLRQGRFGMLNLDISFQELFAIKPH